MAKCRQIGHRAPRYWRVPRLRAINIQRPPFVALGTGRCGTVSLSHILSHCYNTTIFHEAYLTAWDGPKGMLHSMLASMNCWGTMGYTAGVVSFQLWKHIGLIKKAVPSVKVVCMHRSMQEVVHSFLSHWPGKWVFDPWDEKDEDFAIQSCFPNLVGPREATVCQWWQMYEEVAETIEGRFDFMTQDLNDDTKMCDLMDYLEIPEEDRELPEERVYNVQRHSLPDEEIPALDKIRDEKEGLD